MRIASRDGCDFGLFCWPLSSRKYSKDMNRFRLDEMRSDEVRRGEICDMNSPLVDIDGYAEAETGRRNARYLYSWPIIIDT